LILFLNEFKANPAPPDDPVIEALKRFQVQIAAAPLRVSRTFSTILNVSFLGSGVFRSSSRN
jgi:hypothetical protein